MKRIVVSGVVILVLLAGCFVGLGLSWILKRGDDATAEAIQWRPELAWKANEITVNGKKTRFDIPDSQKVDVAHSAQVYFSDGCMFVEFLVTIKGERPLVLTKQALEKIQEGMTYPQVGEALGGVMAKGQISKEFCGDIKIAQGKRRMNLSFYKGKVFTKSAEGIE